MLPSTPSFARSRNNSSSLQRIMIPLLWLYLMLIPFCFIYIIHMATSVHLWVFYPQFIHSVHVRTVSSLNLSLPCALEDCEPSNPVALSSSSNNRSNSINNNDTSTNSSSSNSTNCPSFYPPRTETNYRPRKPMWIAGYPGSGNDLLRNLVEHLSGFPGKDVYTDDHCHLDPKHKKYKDAPVRPASAIQSPQTAATCKTHFPVYRRYPPHKYQRQMTNATAILLIRNPMNAIPSHFNYLWEVRNQVPDHSQQAPEEEWITWRDKHWSQQIRLWQQLLYYWHENYDVLVLPYEHLTQPSQGPVLLQQLAQQLHENHVPNHAAITSSSSSSWLPFETYDFPCHWQYCVQSKRGATVKRSHHAYQPTFTDEQYRTMRRVLTETAQYFQNAKGALAPLLWEYLSQVPRTANNATRFGLL